MLIILMTLLLLNCLKSWSQINNECSLYGGLNIDDTTIVNIPISYIKKANVKLIERNYLIKINNEKDSIINMQANYMVAADSNIVNLINDNIHAVYINRHLEASLNKKKKENSYLKIGIGGIVVGIITAIIIK